MSASQKNLLEKDLEHILQHTLGLWEEFRNERIFVTGGTGFFGCWFLETFIWANEKLGLNAKVVVLSRDPEAFGKKAPHLASNPAVTMHGGDVRSFTYPSGNFQFVIHGAMDSIYQEPTETLEVATAGTKRVLEFAIERNTEKFLFLSSGAVYGRNLTVNRISEDYSTEMGTSPLNAPYDEGKRAGEALCVRYSAQHGLQTKIARCFAFVGPYLPLDAHFAIGNFILNRLREEPIEVKGDGTPRRSYLYAADLMVWLWTILSRGSSCRAYNVGSEESISISALARKIAEEFEPYLSFSVAGLAQQNQSVISYVPATQRARDELGLKELVSLNDAITKTLNWAVAGRRS